MSVGRKQRIEKHMNWCLEHRNRRLCLFLHSIEQGIAHLSIHM